MCELLVGLPDVKVIAVEDRLGGLIVVHVEAHLDQVGISPSSGRVVVTLVGTAFPTLRVGCG
jgi:hypothetical protein